MTGRTGFLIHFPDETVSTSIHLSGRHNVQNAIAAAACCVAAGIPSSDIKTGLEKMQPVSGRMQILTTADGTRIFNDTYNANPASLKAGLEVLSHYEGHRWLVLGDMGELGSQSIELHRQSGEWAREYGIHRLFALGKLSRYAVEGFGNGARHFSTMSDLVSALKQDMTGDVTVLVKGSRLMGMEKVVQSLMEGS
jgi:UDP-N-acetylmuramoyl-tripeptide--D-alanyl-D-alanine ligase